MNRAAIVLLFLAVACAQAAESPFDAAQLAVANLKLARARELFREAQEKDPDPERRDKAAIAMAKIEWRAYHDAAAAREDLALVDPAGPQATNALVDRARLKAGRSLGR